MWKRFLVVMGCAVLMGCGVSDQDKKALQQGYAEYNARDLEGAETAASGFIKKYPNEQSVDEAYYLRGISRLGRGDKTGGAEDLKVAIQKSKRADLKSKAMRGLGDVAYENQQWEEAKGEYAGAIAGGAEAKDLAYLHFRMGECLQAEGNWEGAKGELWKALALNPDAGLKERILAHVNAKSFSIQFGVFGDGQHAADLKGELVKTGLPATVVTELRGGQVVYMVRYGGYATWEGANEARKRFLGRWPMVVIAP